jgi:tetratricopeptide (TPR) repeat protein
LVPGGALNSIGLSLMMENKKVDAFKVIEFNNKLHSDVNRLNDAGYFFLSQGMIDQAIEVLRLNVDYFPADANAYDSLGEVYFIAGQFEKAFQSYK